MNGNYKKEEIEINKILVNTDNARFYDKKSFSKNEIEGMSDIIDLNDVHVINLCKDIAEFGLMPTESLVIMPLEDGSNKMIAYDGNRRLTSLKLITDYKDKLHLFNLSNSQKEQILKLNTNIKKVSCVISNDLEYVNQLLYKIHAPEYGIGRINWKPQSKSKHLKNALSTISKELVFAKLIESFVNVDEDVLNKLSKGSWASKLKRFTPKKEFMLLLGIEFINEANDINCYFEKKDLNKIIIDFFLEIDKNKASEIAQTKLLQEQFIKNFIIKYETEKIILRNRSYTFSAYSNEFFTEGTSVPKEEYKNNLNKYLHSASNDIETSQSTENKTDTPNPGDIANPNNTPNLEDIPNTNNTPNPEDIPNTNDTPNLEDIPNTNDTPNPEDIPNTNDTPNPEDENKADNVDKPTHKDNYKKKKDKKLPLFLSGITRNNINTNDIKNQALILICDEIKLLSTGKITSNPAYKEYPIASTILFRSFVEQCLKYLLRKTMPNEYSRLKNKAGGDPLLSALIISISNKKDQIFTDPLIKRSFNALFNNDGFKDFLDLATHHSMTQPDTLESNAQIFIHIANYILNHSIENIENTPNT